MSASTDSSEHELVDYILHKYDFFIFALVVIVQWHSVFDWLCGCDVVRCLD